MQKQQIIEKYQRQLIKFITSFFQDEYIGSFARRNTELHDIYTFNKSNYLATKKRISRQEYHNVLPSIFSGFFLEEQLLTKTTLYPLHMAIGISKIKSQSVTPSFKWKICTACVIDDIENVGVAYIHRQHLIPGLFYCYKHPTPLDSECPSCNQTIVCHRISEFYACSKKYTAEITSIRGSSRALELSAFAAKLLESGIELRHTYVKYAINRKLSDLGYGEPGRIDFSLANEDALKILGQKDKNKNVGTPSLASTTLPYHSAHTLLKLAYFCFRTAESYFDWTDKVTRHLHIKEQSQRI